MVFAEALEKDGICNPYVVMNKVYGALTSKTDTSNNWVIDDVKHHYMKEIELYDKYKKLWCLNNLMEKLNYETVIMIYKDEEVVPCDCVGSQCHFDCRWLREGKCLVYDKV